MATPAQNAIAALLTNTNFNTLVAELKSKRDEITAYTYSLASLQSALDTTQLNLTTALATEAQLQQQISAAGADIIAAVL